MYTKLTQANEGNRVDQHHIRRTKRGKWVGIRSGDKAFLG